jgi:uncharacterized membrane protein
MMDFDDAVYQFEFASIKLVSQIAIGGQTSAPVCMTCANVEVVEKTFLRFKGQ